MREPLRVLVVSALSTDSGSNLRACRLVRSLKRAGASVRLINGIRSLPLMLHYPISLLLYLRALFIRCDVVIGLKPLPNVGLVLLIKNLLGTVTVVDIDDVDFGFRSGVISRVNRLLQLPTPKRCDLVTYHTDRLRPFIRETFGVSEDRLYQLPQGIDAGLCRIGDDAVGRELRAGVRRNGKLVVYAAHLNIASDLDAILDIIRIAWTRLPDLRFLVVGGGPLERRFRHMARAMGIGDITTFTGYVSPDAVADYLAAGDAALVYYKDIEVNYFRESMKLRDMLALGLRVVCNDVGDLGRFRRYTYQAGSDHQAVAQELVRVLECGGDGREAHGRAYVHAHLDWNDIGERLLERLVEVHRASMTGRPSASAAGGLG
jgi:glycosyltransferase involved in cell wall biosynthesis